MPGNVSDWLADPEILRSDGVRERTEPPQSLCNRGFRAAFADQGVPLNKRIAYMFVAVSLIAGCGHDGPSSVTRELSGEWPLTVSASPSCDTIIQSGYGVAPRGAGTLVLHQAGAQLTGTIAIGGVPAGSLDGSVQDGQVRFSIDFTGKNVGVSSPTDEPCHVDGIATGTTDGYCWLSVKISGVLACPYSCSATDHILVLQRGIRCQ